MDKEIVEAGEKIVKKKTGRPRGGGGKNSPVIGDNGMMTEPGDNAKYLSVSLQLYSLPNIDLDNPEQVQQRLEEFFRIHFEADLKPTVSGMGLALNGMDRRRLWEIRTGNDKAYDLPTPVSDSIKKAYKIMETLWENYMQNGKINPVAGIFLGKNNYGMQDKTEYVLTPNSQQDSDYNADDIKKRYLSDSATIEQLSDGSDS